MKDYYAILGVLPSADDVVIRAVWKALSQRYHPDRFKGDINHANLRMVEINEAYQVLSDSGQRKKYDNSRSREEGNFGDWVYEEAENQEGDNSDLIEKDWQIAVGYYSDLITINKRLSRISLPLAFSYRASLLEQKVFEKREELANRLETSFLHLYFGDNLKIVAFARELIFAENMAAAQALNNSIRVMGSNIEASRLIEKICKDFNFETEEMTNSRLRSKPIPPLVWYVFGGFLVLSFIYILLHVH